jgi:hypothetical protein
LLSASIRKKAEANNDYQKVSQHEGILNEDHRKKLLGNMLSNDRHLLCNFKQ